MKSITFFDVETPNARNDKICAIGIIRTDLSGRIEYKKYNIVNPECGFDPKNIQIHGITPHMVIAAPTFNCLWDLELRDVFTDTLLIAHNVSFDLLVLIKTLNYYHRQVPSLYCDCTLKLSRDYLPNLRGYGLSTICSQLGFPPFRHHDAYEDTNACKELFFYLERKYGILPTCGHSFCIERKDNG